jgi:hypothetical protein
VRRTNLKKRHHLVLPGWRKPLDPRPPEGENAIDRSPEGIRRFRRTKRTGQSGAGIDPKVKRLVPTLAHGKALIPRRRTRHRIGPEMTEGGLHPVEIKGPPLRFRSVRQTIQG